MAAENDINTTTPDTGVKNTNTGHYDYYERLGIRVEVPFLIFEYNLSTNTMSYNTRSMLPTISDPRQNMTNMRNGPQSVMNSDLSTLHKFVV